MTQEQIQQLKELKSLLDSGVLSQEEFDSEKNKIVAEKALRNGANNDSNKDKQRVAPVPKRLIWGVLGIIAIMVVWFSLSKSNEGGGVYDTLNGFSVGIDKETLVSQLQTEGGYKELTAADIQDNMSLMDAIEFDELDGKVGWIEVRFEGGVLKGQTFCFWNETEYERNANIVPIITRYLDSKYTKTGETSYKYGELSITLSHNDRQVNLEYSIK